MKGVVICIFCSIFFLQHIVRTSPVQSSEIRYGDTIFWREGVQLSWDDFNAPINSSELYLATTNANILLEYIHFDYNGAKIRVRAYFNKSKSWAKKDSVDNFILEHELFHFHITEIYARKLRKVISSLKIEVVTAGPQIRKEFETLIKVLDEWQALYDIETQHSIDILAQKKWKKIILDSLNAYGNYSNPEVFIKFHE